MEKLEMRSSFILYRDWSDCKPVSILELVILAIVLNSLYIPMYVSIQSTIKWGPTYSWTILSNLFS